MISPGDEARIGELPFPIAYPLARALDEARPAGERLDNLIFAAEQTLRLAALVLLADYLDGGHRSVQVDKLLPSLRMPHWAEWRQLGTSLAKFWRGDYQQKPSRRSHVESLVSGWLEFNCPSKPQRKAWSTELENMLGLQGPAHSAADALHQARNERHHRHGTRDAASDEHDAALIGRLVPLLMRGLGLMFGQSPWRLIRRVRREATTTYEVLVGPDRSRGFPLESPDRSWSDFLEAEIVVSGSSGAFPAHPFLAPSSGASTRSPDEPVMAIEQVTSKHVVMMGVRFPEERPDLLHAFRAALSRRGIDFGLTRSGVKPWTVAESSTESSRDFIARELEGRKYIPVCYVERVGVDDLLEQALTGDGKALLVLGEAGAGKTSLLCHLVGKIVRGSAELDEATTDGTETPGDAVCFLSGRGDYSGDARLQGSQLLCDAVARRMGVRVGEFSNLPDLINELGAARSQDTHATRRLWIVLDALNEADRFLDLLTAVDECLPLVGQHPWLRVIVSLRAGAYRTLERRHTLRGHHSNHFLSNARWLHTFATAERDPVPYLGIGRFSVENEGPAAYKARQQALPERSCQLPYEALDPRIRSLLLDPLHLHLFHETFQAATMVEPMLDERRLVAAHLAALCRELPSLGTSIDQIGRLMFERRHPMLPIEVADRWLAAWREHRDPAEMSARLNPIEELVSSSLMMRPSEDGFGVDRALVGFTFAHQRLCEHVLVDQLLKRVAPRRLPSDTEFLAWARHAVGPDEPFGELLNALSIIAIEGVQLAEMFALSVVALDADEPREALLFETLRAVGVRVARGELADRQLALVIAAAQSDAVSCERIADANADAGQWLQSHGYTAGSLSLSQGITGVLRDFVAAGRVELRQHLAASLRRVSLLEHASGNDQRSFTFMQEALRVSQDILREPSSSRAAQLEAATTLNALGQWLYAASQRDVREGREGTDGKSEEAHQSFLQAISVLRSLGELDTAGLLLLARVLANVGHVERWIGVGDPKAHFSEAVRILTRLQAEPSAKRILSTVYQGLGGDYRRTAIDLVRDEVRAEPARTDLQLHLVSTLREFARTCLRTDRVLSMELLLEALGIARVLIANEPGRIDMLEALENVLSLLDDHLEDDARGDAYRSELAETRRQLMASAGSTSRGAIGLRLCNALQRLGARAAKAGRPEEAIGHLEECVVVARSCVATEQTVEAQQKLGMALSLLGRYLGKTLRYEEAFENCDQAVELASRLYVAAPESLSLSNDLLAFLLSASQLAVEAGREDDDLEYRSRATLVLHARDAIRLRRN